MGIVLGIGHCLIKEHDGQYPIDRDFDAKSVFDPEVFWPFVVNAHGDQLGNIINLYQPLIGQQSGVGPVGFPLRVIVLAEQDGKAFEDVALGLDIEDSLEVDLTGKECSFVPHGVEQVEATGGEFRIVEGAKPVHLLVFHVQLQKVHGNPFKRNRGVAFLPIVGITSAVP